MASLAFPVVFSLLTSYLSVVFDTKETDENAKQVTPSNKHFELWLLVSMVAGVSQRG